MAGLFFCRHLNAGQRAMAALDLEKLYAAAAKERRGARRMAGADEARSASLRDARATAAMGREMGAAIWRGTWCLKGSPRQNVLLDSCSGAAIRGSRHDLQEAGALEAAGRQKATTE